MTASSVYTPQYVDIGINLTDPTFSGVYHHKSTPSHPSDLNSVLSRSAQAGVRKFLITGSSLDESRKALTLAQSHPSLYSTVGIHPCSSTSATSAAGGLDAHIAQLRDIIESDRRKARAFGEIGLDYDRLHYADATTQRLVFNKQLDLAETFSPQLPLFLHMRAAMNDFASLLFPRIEHGKLNASGVVHSFTGTVEEMECIVAQGLKIGINGCSLKTEENLEVLKKVPLEALCLESDGPWCEIRPSHASAKVLGKEKMASLPGLPAVKKEKWVDGRMVKGRNEPAAVALVAEVVATVKGVDLKEVCEAAWRNSVELFGMHDEQVDGVEKG